MAMGVFLNREAHSWQQVLNWGPGEAPARARSRVGQLGPRGLARRMFSEHQRKPGLKAGGLRPQPGQILLGKEGSWLLWARLWLRFGGQ